MAEPNYYDPNNIPQTGLLQGLFSVLSKGLYKTPEEKYMARMRERDMVQRYAATQPDVDARISQDQATVAQNTARAPTYAPEAQADIARFNNTAARDRADMPYVTSRAADEDFQRRFRTTQDLNQFQQIPTPGNVNGIPALVTGDQPTTRNGSSDSVIQQDHGDAVWEPWDREKQAYQNPELSEMEKPSFVGRDGGLVMPGVQQPQPAPQMARPTNAYVQKFKDWHDAYTQTFKREPTPEESTQHFEMFSGQRPLTGNARIFEDFKTANGGDAHKAGAEMQKYGVWSNKNTTPEIADLEYFKNVIRQEASERGVKLPETAVNRQAEARQRHEKFYGRQSSRGPQTPQEIAANKVAEETVYLEGLSSKQLDEIANDDSEVAKTNPARVTAARAILQQRGNKLKAAGKAMSHAEVLEIRKKAGNDQSAFIKEAQARGLDPYAEVTQ